MINHKINYCVIKVVFDDFNYYYITATGVEIEPVQESTVYRGSYEQCDKRKAKLCDEDDHSYYNVTVNKGELKKKDGVMSTKIVRLYARRKIMIK